MSVSRKLGIVATGSIVALAIATAPASANTAAASNLKTQYLSSNPVNDKTSCSQKPIKLIAGIYDWQEVVAGTLVGDKSITLKADTYTWTTCLSPIYNESTGQEDYTDYSWLAPSSGATAQWGSDFHLNKSGTYVWGDWLVPISN